MRDKLAARAALQRQSMQEFSRCELERTAAWASLGVWLQGVRDRKEAAGTQVSPSSILSARDADRDMAVAAAASVLVDSGRKGK